MADGYVLIEVNEQGESKVQSNGLHWLDFRLEDVSFDDAEGLEQLHAQLPEELKDVLVMVQFDYVCHTNRDYWGDYDCEEYFNVASFQVMKEGYKEFYREMVTEELQIGIGGYENIDCIPEDLSFQDKNYYKELVGEWEEFYDEDFVPFQKEPKKITSIGDLWLTGL